jgi:hypothetical protein
MAQENKQPDIDLDAEARMALSEARAMQPGPERSEAMKRAGVLRNEAAKRGMVWPKLGRPLKD